MADTLAGQELIYFSGINGETGDYDLPPATIAKLDGVITGESASENLSELKARHRQESAQYLGVKEGVDPTKYPANPVLIRWHYTKPRRA